MLAGQSVGDVVLGYSYRYFSVCTDVIGYDEPGLGGSQFLGCPQMVVLLHCRLVMD